MKKIEQLRATFFDYVMSENHNVRTKVDDIHDIINWAPVQKILVRACQYRVDAVGNPGYPPLVLFKVLLLQRLYNLSDAQMAETLADRFSFLRFAGLGVQDSIPDASTICRFRNELVKLELGERLFKQVLQQLIDKGLKIKKGINVDATIVESARHPRKVVSSETSTVDRHEPDLQPEESETSTEASADEKANATTSETGADATPEQAAKTEVSYSDDPASAWTYKQKQYHYGVKVNMASSVSGRFVLGGHVTPANKSDMNELPQVLREIPLVKDAPLNADKGYSSAKNRKAVQDAGLVDHIMAKASRNKPLTEEQKQQNRQISSQRSSIEGIFGHMKRNLGFSRSRYIGIPKITQEFFLMGLVTNLVQAVKFLGN